MQTHNKWFDIIESFNNKYDDSKMTKSTCKEFYQKIIFPFEKYKQNENKILSDKWLKLDSNLV